MAAINGFVKVPIKWFNRNFFYIVGNAKICEHVTNAKKTLKRYANGSIYF